MTLLGSSVRMSRRRDGSHHAPTAARRYQGWWPAAPTAVRGRAPGRTCSSCGRYAPASGSCCGAVASGVDGHRGDVNATEDVDLDVLDVLRPDGLLQPEEHRH